MTRHFLVIAVGLVVCMTGCKPFAINPIHYDLTDKLPWLNKQAQEYDTPDRIVAIWTDTVYQQVGAAPTRGFGGRLYFYNKKGDVVPVNGQLIVYGYDDTQSQEARRPQRKYVFTAEQLTKYYSKSDIGASYNIWVPWEPLGGLEKQITLFPVFVDKSGKMVRGSFVQTRLPGERIPSDQERRGFYTSKHQNQPMPVAADPNAQAARTVQPAGFETPVPGPAGATTNSSANLRVTTIPLPRTLSRRMYREPITATRDVNVPPMSMNQPSGMPQPATSWPSSLTPASTRGPFPPAVRGMQQPSSFVPNPPGNGPANMATPTQKKTAQVMRTPGAQQRNEMSRQWLGQTGFTGVDPQHSVSAQSRAWARQDPRSARFQPPRFRVPTVPGFQPAYGRAPLERGPLTPPGRPSTPTQSAPRFVPIAR